MKKATTKTATRATSARATTTSRSRTVPARAGKTGKTARPARRATPPVVDEPLVLKKPLPRIQRRRSKLHGWGVFALETIPKNTRIINYAGELISNKQSVNREDRYLSKGCIWVFRVNRAWSRDANVGGNIARFINHSCVHNCWVEVVGKTIWIRAGKTIKPGDELTYDYNTEGDKTIPCRCRPNCKTRL